MENENDDNLDAGVEAVLFVKGEPMAIRDLAKLFKTGEGKIEEAVSLLKEKLSGRGLTLIRKGNMVSLASSPEHSEAAGALAEEETDSKLTRAGLETLSIVVYKELVSRAEIDYIRGVNSSFILRNLLIRGLVERIIHPNDSRSFLYRPSFKLLRYLGVGDISELPEYGDFNKKMNEFIEEGKGADDGEGGGENAGLDENAGEDKNKNENLGEQQKEIVGDSDIAA
ncbi:MAG: SMC-Scp complex subunit ScpB [bacterium]|nr:SMC-Scp complex subunit ScpB [bacterium]